MKLLMGRLTCYQCNRAFSAVNLYCPNCGATRRENIGQTSVRRLRGAAVGLIFGALVGVVGVVILGFLFPAWSANSLAESLLLQSRFGLELVGLVLGGMIGTIVYTVMEFGRKP